MKAFIFSITFLFVISSVPSFAQAGQITPNSVFFSNNSDDSVAKKECEIAKYALTVMSTSKIIFQSICEESFNDMKCNYAYCYQLDVKVQVVDEEDQQE